jgi:FtsP/CotA-like multicopper oxidase with cupredoxin domain
MNVKSRYVIYVLPFLLLGVTALPATAGLLLQCPNPLLTRGSAALNQNAFDPVHPADPTRSTDPACRAAYAGLLSSQGSDAQLQALADFKTNCLFDIDPDTLQPSGKTIATSPPLNPSGAATGVVDPNVYCRSLAAGDGHVSMADRNSGVDQTDIGYVFGFQDVTGLPVDFIPAIGMAADNTGTPLEGLTSNFGTNFSAPTLFAPETSKLYLTLTNVGMVERPDLPDPHTVHYHGFTNAASVFDGEPMASFGINMFASLTYYYENVEPGTYMYHCHVEASEHMQMGMLGNLFVTPRQDAYATLHGAIGGHSRFAYDDCDNLPLDVTGAVVLTGTLCGSTGYDIPLFLQETGFDPKFHHNDHTYNPVDFADMNDTYSMLNGRGYPDTVNPQPIINIYGNASQPVSAIPVTYNLTPPLDPVNSIHRIPRTVTAGQKILLRLSSLETVDFYTLTSLGIPMRVIGQGARVLRGPSMDGTPATSVNTSYATGSVTMSGGEAYDIILDTTGVTPGTYFIYSTELNRLANNNEDFGGMMTEIVVQ